MLLQFVAQAFTFVSSPSGIMNALPSSSYTTDEALTQSLTVIVRCLITSMDYRCG